MAMPKAEILAGIHSLQKDLCVQSVAESRVQGYAERQHDLLIRLAAADCPLPIRVVFELHNLCEAAPLINDVRGRGHQQARENSTDLKEILAASMGSASKCAFRQ